MDTYLATFLDAASDAQSLHVHPKDFVEHLIEGLGSELTRTSNIATLMGGCVGTYGPVRVYTDLGVPLGTVRRSVGF